MGWAALSELVPLYPLYALLFLDTGVSAGQLSLLFAVWSVTGLLAEVPAGLLADRWSRRGVLAAGGALQAAAFVLWTATPSFGTFVAGFVVWGVAGACTSGTAEALVHDGLADVGAAESFARVNGAMTAAELLVQVPTALAAAGLYAVGGYPLVGWVSAGVCLGAGALALRFPEPPRGFDEEDDGGSLRAGLAPVLRRPPLLGALAAVALIGGLDGMEEYFPVLAAERGVPEVAVPGAVLIVSLAGAAGAALGGRAGRPRARALAGLLAASGAGLLLLPGAPPVPALLLLSAAYGLYLAVLVAAEAELQRRISGPYRATVTSVAGVGIELSALLVFAAFATGGVGAVGLLVLAVVPVAALGLRRPR
ncbi:MFS transporter [Blastococcus xanthinilyticus]|uniref:Putative MFS family arabinose efflux permease n=1 Tax=Blastococcus xanthinilyticus TaxID=1564164 RepID=A0A5S5CN17_9ACTN|nr:MFS transporter [Blastococcus xanthinilyticus]TYP83791.1 putative MFS family arabinose efflux permease [Blastococcus xanthinilyticus]